MSTPNIPPATTTSGYALNATPQRRQTSSIPVQQMGRTEVITSAPTLGQFWRSDVRHTTTGRRPRWAGTTAFWFGLAAIGALLAGTFLALPALTIVALALSATAGFFALVALIAGIGRWLGFLGLLFALAGNATVIDALGRLFG